MPPPSFEQVYDRHFDFVYRSVRRLGVAEDAAEDVVQEVFLIAHQKLAEFEGRASIKTWLFAIARNVIRGRTRRREHRTPHVEVPESLSSDAPSPFEETAQMQARDVLGHLLMQLDEQKREVFILTELEQMTAPEISEAIGVKLPTVYTRIRAARQAFQAHVERLYAGEGKLPS